MQNKQQRLCGKLPVIFFFQATLQTLHLLHQLYLLISANFYMSLLWYASQRPLKYFQFAQLYYKIGQYEQARRYVTVYLGVRPQAVNALNLLGRSLEKLGRPEAALDAYRSSLNQDYKQNNIVIKSK